MKFKLIIKNVDNGETIEEKVYKSINQIAKELNTTYCSCQSNYLLNLGEKKQPAKRSQILFNKKYSIIEHN